MSRIVRLIAENVKRLRTVQVELGAEAVVSVRGNNGQGKSSVLDSIAYALGGGKLAPPKVIREGATEAMVELELDDGLVVRRRWNGKSSTLEVRPKDGAKYSSPQTMLDGLVGRLSFDPLAFLKLEPKLQAEELRKLVGLDFTKLDGQRAEAFEKRTTANRVLGELEAQLKALADVPETEAVDVSALTRQLLDAQRERQRAGEVQRAWEQAAESLKGAHARVSELERQLEAAREELLRLNGVELDARKKLLSDSCPTVEDVEKLGDRIAGAEAINELARKCVERTALSSRVTKGLVHTKELTRAIEEIDARKKTLLEHAPFPVEGLGFGATGVTFNGVPLEQASSAEQLRVALGMGIAANPTLKVILIRDGSLLDAKSLELVAQQADAAGVQVWLEVVGTDGMGIIIEDGAVAEVRHE